MATGYEPNVEGALAVLVDLMNANAFTMTRQPYEPNYRGLVDALIDLKKAFQSFLQHELVLMLQPSKTWLTETRFISGPAMARLVKHWLMEP